MSHNQSRAERSNFTHSGRNGRSGSSNQQVNFGYGKGVGHSVAPSNSFNRSFKNNINPQGGQWRTKHVSSDSPNSVATSTLQNGTSNAPDSGIISFKQEDKSKPGINQLSRDLSSDVSSEAPSSSISAVDSNSQTAIAHAKRSTAPRDASKWFPLQFGSISPGFMNEIQIPARTSSAPPNLDEQKNNRNRHDALRAAPTLPNHSVPKHVFPKMEEKVLDHPCESQPVQKTKLEAQVSSSLPVTHTQDSSSTSIRSKPVQLPNHQTQIPPHFGGPVTQIPAQSTPGTSLPPTIPLTIGNTSMQQSLPLPPQGMMHQGQSLNFFNQVGPQMHQQLGNVVVAMPPQFPVQQAEQYSSSRKTVKITHPETHEELRLDGSVGLPHPNMGSSPQNSINIPPSTQPSRIYKQVIVKPADVSIEENDTGRSTGSQHIEKGKSSQLNGEGSVHVLKDFEYSSSLSLLREKSSFETTPYSDTCPIPVKMDNPNTTGSAVALIDNATSILDGLAEKARNGTVKVKEQSPCILSLPSQLSEDAVIETRSPSSDLVLGIVTETPLTSLHVTSGVSTFASPGAGDNKTVEKTKSVDTNNAKYKKSNPNTVAIKKGEPVFSQCFKPKGPTMDASVDSLSSHCNAGDISDQQRSTSETNGLHAKKIKEEHVGYLAGGVNGDDNVVKPTFSTEEGNNRCSVIVSGISDHGLETSLSVASVRVSDSLSSREATFLKHDMMGHKSSGIIAVPSKKSVKQENKNIESDCADLSKENIPANPSVEKGSVPKLKKKKKELYRKAEAAGTSSDLYMAYKGPEQKKETEIPLKSSGNTPINSTEQTFVNLVQETLKPSQEPAQTKVELDNWEDAADLSTPRLESSRIEHQGDGVDVNGSKLIRYSSDFLCTFARHCSNLPEDFEITSEIADSLFSIIPALPISGRKSDRHPGGNRLGRRSNGVGEERKWELLGHPMLGRGDARIDASNDINVRSGNGGNSGVLRNTRAVNPVQYSGGVLSGPQGIIQRQNSDSERWQRNTALQKGSIASAQTPLQMMHKAEKKYEVGKVSGEEEIKQRQLKAILNKLTPQNFDKLFEQVKQVNIDNVITLSGVISQIFDKALMEPTFCEMYANFCCHLAAVLPDLSVENEKITFKVLLLNKCQEEFERGEREEEEANKGDEADDEGMGKLSVEAREEKRVRIRRRMLGNIRLIGELYKKRMLTERIMHECIKKLLGQYQNPDEENIEALCKLMSTIGEMIDHTKAKDHIDSYINIMEEMSCNMKLSSRVRFMLKDTIDLRKNNWQQRMKVEGPKKIDDVHRDAAQERHAQASRLSRAPSFGSSVRRGQPPEFSPRVPGSLSSPTTICSSRAVPQHRSSSCQAVRLETFGKRNMPVSLPHRPLGDDSTAHVPQGSFAHGIPFGKHPSLNGLICKPEQAAFGQGENLIPKFQPDRLSSQSYRNMSHSRERNSIHGSRETMIVDRMSDKTMPISSSHRETSHISQNISSEKAWPEEHLQEMSMSAIKEFYSAKDENEIALCIKDLDAPSFYPSMISIWVIDSFERKDLERNLLSKLLISLAKSRDIMISEYQFVKGFESVLATLEDAVNDAPRAAEFLGHILAKITLEGIVSLSEIGRLILEGSLVELGIAAEVLGSVLETIQSEKGDSVLKDILSGMNLQLENFLPTHSNRSLKISKFI